jgi:hypothetical protein
MKVSNRLPLLHGQLTLHFQGKGSSVLISIFRHLGLDISYPEEQRWLKVLTARKKRDDYHQRPDIKVKRAQYKKHAQTETGICLRLP